MKRFQLLIMGALLCSGVASFANPADSIPDRAIILTGNPLHPDHIGNIAEMYSRMNLAFQDPAAPRFLFLDKKGEVALGIGGYLKAIGEYDFDGAVDNPSFFTNLIPVPNNPAMRQQFNATAAHSTVFLKLVTRPTRVGRVIVYIQTNFTGGGSSGYGLKLKQAYLTVGHVTAGKARTTFADGPAMAPTVDDQGPSGQVGAKNMLVRYETSNYGGFSAAISAELPDASYTVGADSRKIGQRVPDIPAYVQYAWDGGDSHIRLSGMLRQLCYRNLATEKNHFATGWGVQLSAVANIYGGLGFFGHYTWGKGIAAYINDFADEGLDLIPDMGQPGKLRAPGTMAFTAGLRYDFNKKFFITGAYSRAQMRDLGGMDASTERYAQYIDCNAFYNIWGDLMLGVEYLHGTRKDLSGLSGHANRIEAMLQYSF